MTNNDYFSDRSLVGYLRDNLDQYSFLLEESKDSLKSNLFDKLDNYPSPGAYPKVPRGYNINKDRYVLDFQNRYNFSILNAIDKDKDFIVLWQSLLKSSLMCLKSKDPGDVKDPDEKYGQQDYGVKELSEYLDSFSHFEGLLYGSSRYYRDHLYHTLKVWLLGSYLMKSFLTKKAINGVTIYDIFTDVDERDEIVQLEKNPLCFDYNEFDSIWCIIALTHDLGYPLEKLPNINELIRKALPDFGTVNLQDFQYQLPIQNQFSYEYLLKFVSSRIETRWESSAKECILYTTHIQPKYYIKLLNSFEKMDHGIMSCILLMRQLIFFLESDFDYSSKSEGYFKTRDAKQFQIRREILRSIASHTCDNIYHLRLNSLPFLLLICDEMQEWGRPKFGENILGEQDIIKVACRIFTTNCIKYDIHLWTGANREVYRDYWKLKVNRFRKLFRTAFDWKKRNFEFEVRMIIHEKYREKGFICTLRFNKRGEIKESEWKGRPKANNK